MHEMDAIFWKEWRIFGFSEDLSGRQIFVLAHLPLCFIILYALANLNSKFGKVVSMLLSSFLILHFFLHFKALSENYFTEIISFGIISLILIVSIVQLVSTLMSLKQNRLQSID
jgi:hypothetical protein